MRQNEYELRCRQDGFEKATKRALIELMGEHATTRQHVHNLAAQMVDMATLLTNLSAVAAQTLGAIKDVQRVLNRSEELDNEGVRNGD